MKERYAEIENAILSVLWDNPGIGGLELVQRVSMGDSEEVFSMLDILLEEGEVVFNEEEDQWSLSDMGNYYDEQRGFKS